MVVLLFLTEHETIVHSNTDAIASLLSDPRFRDEVLCDPSHLPLAVEEFLRFHSRVMMTKMHYARGDLVFEDVALRKTAASRPSYSPPTMILSALRARRSCLRIAGPMPT